MNIVLMLALNVMLAENHPVKVGSQKQLFVDDYFIQESEGIKLTINPPRKDAKPCIIAEKPWESFEVGGYNTVMEDEGIYKMWYDAMANDGSRWLCYATSQDGIHWEKPELGLVEFDGNKENNIVFPLVEKRGHEPGCVFIDKNPGCPPEQKYKMVCSCDGLGGNGTYLFYSTDGLRWNPISDKPSFRPSDTGNVCFWDKRIGRYVAYVRIWSPMRMVGRCEFDDLSDWGKEQTVFPYDELDPPDMDFYTNAAIKYPFAENVYLMFPSAYFHYPEPPVGKYSNDGPLDIRFATSRDGIHWTRIERRPFVSLGIKGEWDDSAIYMTTGLIRNGAEIWMYYTGYDFTHGAYNIAEDKFKGGIGRLTLRLDGYISADAEYTGGSLTTVPLTFSGKQLQLNVQTSVAGSVQVEILDADGKAVPGFSLSDVDVIKGNFIDKTVRWQGNADVSSLDGKPIQLHFVMRDAKLYAFQFVEQ